MSVGPRLLPVWGVLALCFPSLQAGAVELRLLGRYEMKPGGAEIIKYCSAHAVLLSTRSHWRFGKGVEVIDLKDPENPRLLRRIDLGGEAWGPESVKLGDVSSVTVDPLGRGFGAASLIPERNAKHLGRVVFFDFRDGQILKTLPTGYHPDAVAFSADGRHLLVADEGEYVPRGSQVPGSLTVVDLAGVTATADLRRLGDEAATTYRFTEANGVTEAMLVGLRNHHGKSSSESLRVALEPEYVTEVAGKVYVSIQENNALGVFDLATRRWEAIHNLGVIEQLIDPSDRDGAFGASRIGGAMTVAGLPMPDTIRGLDFAGRTLIFTANEGDGRAHGNGDLMRLKHAGVDGPQLAPEVRRALKAQLGADPLRDPYLGRLQVSRFDGLNEAGRIERPTMLGTRSFSIWDGETGELIYDSGSFFETYIRSRDPVRFNMNRDRPGSRDTRSDNRGAEIEAIDAIEHDGALWIAVGSERQNGIFLFRAENPEHPVFHAYANLVSQGDHSPESICLIPPSDREDGRFLMAVAYEGSSTVALFEIR